MLASAARTEIEMSATYRSLRAVRPPDQFARKGASWHTGESLSKRRTDRIGNPGSRLGHVARQCVRQPITLCVCETLVMHRRCKQLE